MPGGAARGESQTLSALRFHGAGSYAGMGRAPELGLSTFTLECWFKLLGPGTSASSRVGGITGVPLICKGRAVSVGDPRDCNYFFAVRMPERTLAVDFNDTQNGANHPLSGSTPVADGTWYHGAVTFDGTSLRLYLNGQPEAELAVNATPRASSQQHFSLGAAVDAAGVPAGGLDGIMDEVRVWNHARSSQQVRDGMQSAIRQATGLVGRWGFSEGTGSYAGNTASASVVGTITGATWAAGVSFPAALDVATLASSSVTSGGATIGGMLSDFGAATSAQTFIRWGTTAGSLNRSTAPQTLTAPGAFQRTLAGQTAGSTVYYRAVAQTGAGTAEGMTLPVIVGENRGLQLSGAGDYVSMGSAALGAGAFTLECWFKLTGTGQSTSTGLDGVQAVPLITKGRDETEGGLRDCNYFLGISADDGRLVADFEEAGTSINHPVFGTTPVTQGVWNHAAATYDGSTWRLYLNGWLESERPEGAVPQQNSVQMFALGTALNTNGDPDGYLAGIVDEVRVWNVARTRAEILETINARLPSAPGLIGRWGFEEGLGSAARDTSGRGHTGFIASGTWTAGAPFNLNVAPDTPVAVHPTPEGMVSSGDVDLRVHVSDPDGDAVQVQFFGRALAAAPAPPFRIVALPDTQYYSQTYASIFTAQVQWILDHRESLNIVYVAHLGDIVNNADRPQQWVNANAALSLFDGVPDLPLGLAVGNHDQYPNGDPEGTQVFNTVFPFTRYQDRTWYGGHFGADNDNHYVLFSAGGMDFIAIHFEYDTSPEPAVLNWAKNLLTTYASRRGIVVAHTLMGVGNPGSWTAQGSATYSALKTHPNLMLMLCGHISGEGQRTDVAAGTVHTLLADYQSRTNGGNGWLRMLEFVPADNAINVTTYSPILDQYETDANSQFTLPHGMGGAGFALLGTVNVPSGTVAGITWPELGAQQTCDWYAKVSDGQNVIESPVWRFTTGTVPMDLDGDFDVDEDDLGLFLGCHTGANVRYEPESLPASCRLEPAGDGRLPADHDADRDVDQSDFGILQRCTAGRAAHVETDCDR